MSTWSEKDLLKLLAEADTKANSQGDGIFFNNKTTHHEEAVAIYAKVASIYLGQNKGKESGDAFCKAAEMSKRLGEKHDEANYYVKASKSYRNATPKLSALAIICLRNATNFLMDEVLAKCLVEMASIYESDLENLEGAMREYREAALLYQDLKMMASAHKWNLKVAMISAQLEEYERSFELFEEVGKAKIGNTFDRYECKECFLKAGLCRLAFTDFEGAKEPIANYWVWDSTFESTRESQFLKSILKAAEESDVELFNLTVTEYDNLSKLDGWKSKLLLKVEQNIGTGEGLI